LQEVPVIELRREVPRMSTKTDGMISLLKNETDLLPEMFAGSHR